jgi:hypothetical protein
MSHVGFDLVAAHDSEYLARAYGESVLAKWSRDEREGALYDLGCIIHLMQDAGFCGHSRASLFLDFKKTTTFENYVKQETTPNKKPKSQLQLKNEGWLINYGGCYLKEPWRDEQGRSHWAGGLEAWIDVAAHLAYEHSEILSESVDDCEYQGQARQQFVIAQKCGAGLLVDFFRQVGVIEDPWINYLRGREVWRVRLDNNSPERVGSIADLNSDNLWPITSPNGYSRLSLHQERGGSQVDVTVNANAKLNQTCTGWDFPDEDRPSAPKRVSRAFYPSNYFIALVDAAEGDDWRHLFLVPSVPSPNYWWTCERTIQFFFDDWEDLRKHHCRTIELP